MTNQSELPMNKIEAIIADHNKAMRTDMASEITGGTRSKAITDVITIKAIAALITQYADRREAEGVKRGVAEVSQVVLDWSANLKAKEQANE